jgi:outer membrane protein TolC
VLALASAGAAGGCASPVWDRDEAGLRRSIAQSTGRELVQAQLAPEPIVLHRENRVEALELRPEVMSELRRMAGPRSYAGTPMPLPAPLVDRPARSVPVTLERVVRSCVENNLDVQFARLSPAISEARLVAAEAAFDWTLFNNFQWNSTDQPRTQTGFGASRADQRQVVSDALGVRRRLTTGGQFTAQHQYTYTDVNSPNLTVTPNPAYEPSITMQLDQPLLRGFGSDVALAQVRLAANEDRDQVQNLKTRLIQAVADAEAAYWDLIRAQHDVLIISRLLEEGEKVRQKLHDRLGFDVAPSTYSDAVSKVQRRKALLIQVQRNLVVASNRLKQQMNDPEYPVGSEVVLVAADEAVDGPVQFSLLDALTTAVQRRPEVQRALLSIDNTTIRVQVAENARLPLLDLRLLTRFNGMGANPHDSYDSLLTRNFVDYQVGLNFEQPIGNREAEANFRIRQLERMQAVIAYRNTIQGIVGEVRNALTDVVTNYDLIEQTRAARYAAAENLRALIADEENRPGITPEFLNLKLQRQEELSTAERAEIQALADYNNALAVLYRAMGTSLERNRIRFEVPDVVQRAPTSPLYPAYPLPK